MPEKSEDTTNMSDNTKEIEFYESLREEAIQKNDADKLSFAETKLDELKSGVSVVTSASIAFPHAGIFDFDAFSETGSDFLNKIVDKMLTDQYLELHKRYGEQIEQLTGANRSLQIENDALTSTNGINEVRIKQITEEKNKYKMEADEYESRFKALEIKYNEDIAEKDAEIERRKNHEDDLRQQLANAPAPTARMPIEITPATMDIEEFVQQAKKFKEEKARREEEERKAALIKITNKRWENEFKQTNYAADLVVDCAKGKAGDTIIFSRFDIGFYLEVTADDAARFRAEQIAEQGNTDSAEVVAENNPLVIPVAQTVQDFRADGVTTAEAEVPESTEPSVSGGVVSEAPVTWEAIEARLTAFKQEVIKEIMIGEVA